MLKRFIPLTILTFIFFNTLLLASQPINISGNFNTSIFNPSINHALTLQNPKFFNFKYSYSGFFAESGELSFSVKDSTNNIYRLAAAYPYLMLGYSKSFANHQYLNLNLATYWASVGYSRIMEYKPLINYEISFDAFVNRGYSLDMYGWLPYYRGIVSKIAYHLNFGNKVQVELGVGLSLLQIRKANIDGDYGMEYINFGEEKKSSTSHEAWSDILIMIPVELAISLSF